MNKRSLFKENKKKSLGSFLTHLAWTRVKSFRQKTSTVVSWRHTMAISLDILDDALISSLIAIENFLSLFWIQGQRNIRKVPKIWRDLFYSIHKNDRSRMSLSEKQPIWDFYILSNSFFLNMIYIIKIKKYQNSFILKSWGTDQRKHQLWASIIILSILSI